MLPLDFQVVAAVSCISLASDHNVFLVPSSWHVAVCVQGKEFRMAMVRRMAAYLSWFAGKLCSLLSRAWNSFSLSGDSDHGKSSSCGSTFRKDCAFSWNSGVYRRSCRWLVAPADEWLLHGLCLFLSQGRLSVHGLLRYSCSRLNHDILGSLARAPPLLKVGFILLTQCWGPRVS